MTPASAPEDSSFIASRGLVLAEIEQAVEAISPQEIAAAAREILLAKRIFVAGAGRSGLALKMVAMRLMHLGLQVFVAGETTTPSISAGDLLIVASASGTTSSVLHAGQVAKRSGAKVLTVTSAPESPLSGISDAIVNISAAAKAETVARKSQQYAGSLFEQVTLLLFDVLFHTVWKAGTQSYEELLARHTNLE